jgi:hypothetical protein
VPQLGAPAEEEDGRDRLHHRPAEVGDEHEAAARHAVRPHARRQHEERHRHHLGGEHQPQLGRAPVQAVEHRERERHRQQRVADHRDRLAREQQAEVAVAEDGDVTHGCCAS